MDSISGLSVDKGSIEKLGVSVTKLQPLNPGLLLIDCFFTLAKLIV
jgi:hypothetical protein